jgi:hypothetical protein
VVLIGTSRYETLAGLPSVEENLMALAEALCAGQVWGLPEQHVAIVADPSVPADMLDPVVRAADDATDTMVLYYAGHGLIDPRGDLHLALVGSDPQRSYTAVRYDHIRDALLASRAARRIVILDCCYSGRALGMMADPVTAAVDEAAAEGTYILAAAAENKQALAPPGEPHTAFTAELLTILRSGIPGRGALLDLDAIYHHVRAAMRAKARPEPQKRDRNTAGQLTLIHNQAYRSAGESAAPQRVRPATTQPQPAPIEAPPNPPPEHEVGPVEVTDNRALERDFHAAMVEVYKRAKQEAGYPATYFIQMVSQRGGLATARHLLHAPKVSDGFTALWERGRLDLSVETLVLQERFAQLFTDEEREGARSRLDEYGYSPPAPAPGPGLGMSTRLIKQLPYDAKYHRAGTRAAAGGCSWHGQTCHDTVIGSVLTRDKGGEVWHAVCRRALDTLRAG